MLLKAYYDAASTEATHDQPLVVAGLLATEQSWVEFDRAWKAVLSMFGITHLHMKDCAHWRGEFKAWRDDPNRDANRALFLDSLIEVLRRTAVFGSIFRVLPADYNAVNEEYAMETDSWSGAYSLCAMRCVHQCERWAESRFPRAQIAHVLERGDTGQGVVANWIERSTSFAPEIAKHVFPLSIQAKRDEHTGDWCHRFDACDFVAYEHRLAVSRAMAGRNPFERKSFQTMLRKIPSAATYLNKEMLTAWCHAHPEAYPRRDGRRSPPYPETEELKRSKRQITEGEKDLRRQRASLKRMKKEMDKEADD